jgi:hypothetical protein
MKCHYCSTFPAFPHETVTTETAIVPDASVLTKNADGDFFAFCTGCSRMALELGYIAVPEKETTIFLVHES